MSVTISLCGSVITQVPEAAQRKATFATQLFHRFTFRDYRFYVHIIIVLAQIFELLLTRIGRRKLFSDPRSFSTDVLIMRITIVIKSVASSFTLQSLRQSIAEAIYWSADTWHRDADI